MSQTRRREEEDTREREREIDTMEYLVENTNVHMCVSTNTEEKETDDEHESL